MSNNQITPLSRPESPVSVEPVKPTFDPDILFSSFLGFVDRKPATMKGYNNALKQFAKWLSDNAIRQPNRDDLKAYRDALKASDLEAATQSQYLQAVKMFFRWTASEGIYPNVADNLHGPKVRRDVHRKDALTKDAVVEITDQIDRSTEKGKRLFAIVLLEITAGLRCCEVSRANVCDLKENGGRWYLWVQGKGHDQKDAAVEIVPEVYQAITDYLTTRTAEVTKKSPLFTSTSNANKDGRIAPSTISAQIKQAMKAAGYDSDRLTAHSLRHTSATAVFKATGDIYLTQKHQRHADISTTEIYVHAEERENRHTEQTAYDYYFGDGDDRDIKKEIFQAIDTLNGDQLEEVFDFVQGVTMGEVEAG